MSGEDSTAAGNGSLISRICQWVWGQCTYCGLLSECTTEQRQQYHRGTGPVHRTTIH